MWQFLFLNRLSLIPDRKQNFPIFLFQSNQTFSLKKVLKTPYDFHLIIYNQNTPFIFLHFKLVLSFLISCIIT